LAGRRYLTVHNGFDPDFVISRATTTKCYPHFASVVSELKLRYPQLLLVQIGGATSTPIAGVDVGLIGRTTIPEAAAVIAGAQLHLDNESGLVHMAACLGTRSCVLFGPTDADYFGYPQNINLRPGCCGGCWWTTDSWMDQCPRGFATPPCMDSIVPEDVVRHLLRTLRCPPASVSSASVQP
jgi:ADP-heptose:LPS heptosyltransferase